MKTVIAAIDLGPSSRRVLYHAAGFARLLSGELKVLHVNGASAESRAHVLEYCRREGPYEIDFEEKDVIVSSGLVSEIILRESIRQQAQLVVIGSRGRGGLAKLILGSTSDAVLRAATVPVLVVPPTDLDIVNISDRATLTCGPVLAAIDLAEHCDHQLELAAGLAMQSSQSLLMMTVAPMRLSEHAAGVMLRQRAHQLNGNKPHAMIVRRGDVADEISRCALAEGSGLVVMGLRARPRGTPGAIASAVLKTNRAFVLGVPGC
jgi:nucleotide-binding universal stress UspA family protein